ncbi:MAG: thiamine phosphate synthase, partial [Myxococcota bacterium]
MNPKLLRLYLVTDPGYLPHPRVLALLPGLVEAGVTLVQLRDKQADTRTLLDLAKAYLSVLRPRGVPLIVNDRADVAVASGADGVHVGTSDLPAAAVRALTGSNAIV